MPQEQLTHLKILPRSAPSLLRLTLDTFLTSREAMRLSPASLFLYLTYFQQGPDDRVGCGGKLTSARWR